MDDIVERLRAAAKSGDLALGQSFNCLAVADEIERLRTENAAMRRQALQNIIEISENAGMYNQ